jgi:hypothetical protein
LNHLREETLDVSKIWQPQVGLKRKLKDAENALNALSFLTRHILCARCFLSLQIKSTNCQLCEPFLFLTLPLFRTCKNLENKHPDDFRYYQPSILCEYTEIILDMLAEIDGLIYGLIYHPHLVLEKKTIRYVIKEVLATKKKKNL